MSHELSTHKHVEHLIRATNFKINVHCNTVICLHHRIQKFIHIYILTTLLPFLKQISLYNLLNRKKTSNFYEFDCTYFAKPLAVKTDLNRIVPCKLENFASLFFRSE